jgi:branched-chain amino acid transport system permease protein
MLTPTEAKWTPELNLLDEPGLKCINGLSNNQDGRNRERSDRAGPDGQGKRPEHRRPRSGRNNNQTMEERPRGRRNAAATARGDRLMDLLPLLPQALADGLLLGGVYAIVAVGLTMTFGVLRIVNFAHGDFLAIGLYLTYLGAAWLGLDPYLSLLLVLPLVTLAAAFTYKLLIAPVILAPEHNQIVVTLGLSLILQNAMLAFFTADLHAIPSVLSGNALRLGNVFVQTAALIASAASIALCLGLYWFLRSTELGRLIRAAAQDRDAARLCGVDVDRMYLFAFCIGVGSLGLVAPLIAPFNYVSPGVGSNFTLTAFVVVVLGSMGNFAGALLGGFIVGIVEAVGGLVTGGSINFIITYAIFVLFLLFKPEGLLGGRRL